MVREGFWKGKAPAGAVDLCCEIAISGRNTIKDRKR
jgi:hypothetical protein